MQEDTAHCCGGWAYDFGWISKLDRVQYGDKETMSGAFYMMVITGSITREVVASVMSDSLRPHGL